MQPSDLKSLENIFLLAGITTGNYREGKGLGISARSEEHMNAFMAFITEALKNKTEQPQKNLTSDEQLQCYTPSCGDKYGSYGFELDCLYVEQLIDLIKQDDEVSAKFISDLQAKITTVMQNELKFLLNAIESLGIGSVSYIPEHGCIGTCYNSAEFKALKGAIGMSFTHNGNHTKNREFLIITKVGNNGKSSYYEWKIQVEQELIERNMLYTSRGFFSVKETFASKLKQEYEKYLVLTSRARGDEFLNHILDPNCSQASIPAERLENLKKLIAEFKENNSPDANACRDFNKAFDELRSAIGRPGRGKIAPPAPPQHGLA